MWKQSDPVPVLAAGVVLGLREGKNRSWRSERKLGQKMQQIVCKRMIQAALIWICSLLEQLLISVRR